MLCEITVSNGPLAWLLTPAYDDTLRAAIWKA
jgi:hypothetical protein